MLRDVPSSDYDTEEDASAPVPPASAPAARVACGIELGKFNPGFWNHPDYIRRNNCYNYASNKRTNTFAQPGKGCGHIYTPPPTCSSITTAAICDGLHHRFNCFPASEKPRWFVALVVDPGFDYHWYRKQAENFWGHKPGGTAARNTDNNGRVIYNPETCVAATIPISAATSTFRRARRSNESSRSAARLLVIDGPKAPRRYRGQDSTLRWEDVQSVSMGQRNNQVDQSLLIEDSTRL